MSRPDELPRSASPLKRRAPSLPPDENTENTDALEDVDMLSVPATNQGSPIGDAESLQGTEQVAEKGAQEVESNVLNLEPLAPAVVEETDPDIPDLDGLEVDRASVEETQVGSDPEDNALDDNALEGRAPSGNDAQGQGQEHGKEKDQKNQKDHKDQNSATAQVQGQTASSSTTEDTTESDAKTIDTVATSASTEASNKPCKSPNAPYCAVTC